MRSSTVIDVQHSNITEINLPNTARTNYYVRINGDLENRRKTVRQTDISSQMKSFVMIQEVRSATMPLLLSTFNALLFVCEWTVCKLLRRRLFGLCMEDIYLSVEELQALPETVPVEEYQSKLPLHDPQFPSVICNRIRDIEKNTGLVDLALQLALVVQKHGVKDADALVVDLQDLAVVVYKCGLEELTLDECVPGGQLCWILIM